MRGGGRLPSFFRARREQRLGEPRQGELGALGFLLKLIVSPRAPCGSPALGHRILASAGGLIKMSGNSSYTPGALVIQTQPRYRYAGRLLRINALASAISANTPRPIGHFNAG